MRPLRVLDPTPSRDLYDALRDALDGTGPAVTTHPDVPTHVDDEVALLVPTSGSTGAPRLVELTTGCLAASARATAQVLGEGRWWLTLPLTHVAGLQVVVRSLLQGREPSTSPDGCRFTSLVPTQLQRLLDDPVLTRFDAILVGGAATPPDLLARARGRGLNVVTTYGMTETSGGCVYDGVPLPGVRLDVADRIVVSGKVVARGYHDGERFAGSFATSDLGELDGQRLTVHGRADDVIVTGGEKVAPAAVEAALTSHPSVLEAVVVGVPDEEWGERVVAVVVLREGSGGIDVLQAHCRAKLSSFKRPERILLMDELPRTSTGKLLRRDLIPLVKDS
jgi:O-succinylbenzoic acid--CoA ligase